jgi:hypothetical protein
LDATIRSAYAVLELSPPVSAADLKRQYRALAKRWHPDRHAADPALQAQASERMRAINDAFRVVAEAVERDVPVPSSPRVEWTPPRASSGLSRSDIDAIVDAVNRSHTWTPWPAMSRERWLSVAAVMTYFFVAAVLVSGTWMRETAINNAVLGVFGYLWLPLFFLWKADKAFYQGRTVLRAIGWTLMAAPAVIAVVLLVFSGPAWLWLGSLAVLVVGLLARFRRRDARRAVTEHRT